MDANVSNADRSLASFACFVELTQGVQAYL